MVSLNERRWLGDGSFIEAPVDLTNVEIEGFGHADEAVGVRVEGAGTIGITEGAFETLQWVAVGDAIVEVSSAESEVILSDLFGADVERFGEGITSEIELDNLDPWASGDTLYVMDNVTWFQGPVQRAAESLPTGATRLTGAISLGGFRSIAFNDAVAYQLSYMDGRLEQFGIVRIGSLSGSIEGGIVGALREPGYIRSLELDIDPSRFGALAPCEGATTASGQVRGGGRGVALEGGSLVASLHPIRFESFSKQIGIPLFEMSVALSGKVSWACPDPAVDDDAAAVEFYRDVDGGQSLPAFDRLALPTNVLLDGEPVADVSSIEPGAMHRASWDATTGACQYRVEIVSYGGDPARAVLGSVATRSTEAVLPARFWEPGRQVRIEVAAAFEDCARSQLRVRQVPSDWAVFRSAPLSVR